MRFTRMMILSVAIAAGVGAAFLAGVAHAQGAKVTINDPAGPPPDPTHIPTVLPKDIKWTGQEGKQQMGLLFGDPNKAGLYGVVYKWYPGNFSQPHFHDQERYAYVISGTWWVSTSNVYDEKTTYPVRAGTVAIDKANTVHWDGARIGRKGTRGPGAGRHGTGQDDPGGREREAESDASGTLDANDEFFQRELVTGVGIEPTARALKVRCSTTELPGREVGTVSLSATVFSCRALRAPTRRQGSPWRSARQAWDSLPPDRAR